MQENIKKYVDLINNYAKNNYEKMLREAAGFLKYKFIVPGSVYSDCLWDWDCWLTNIALRRITGDRDISEYEKGCVLNFIEHIDDDGKTPIVIKPDLVHGLGRYTNIHKPCLAQHALFVSEQNNDVEWLREKYVDIERFLGYYENNCKHESGLYFWMDDCAIGVDNDPCTFYRPEKSSASIYLNCLMYKEKAAMAELARLLGLKEKQEYYNKSADQLKNAIQENCWDERDGFFYSVDINLLPIDKSQTLHAGAPRHWNCLIQRIDVWSGFMAMWAGIATPEQAQRMVKEHYLNEKSFNAPFGVRTLSKLEKMYSLKKTGNPSCWLGPIWGISNYMVFEGLVKYGFTEQARDLANKTIMLFGTDIEKCGEMHEYYNPDTGEGINNPGFQNWNLLVLNMIEWLSHNNY